MRRTCRELSWRKSFGNSEFTIIEVRDASSWQIRNAPPSSRMGIQQDDLGYTVNARALELDEIVHLDQSVETACSEQFGAEETRQRQSPEPYDEPEDSEGCRKGSGGCCMAS